ncbi:MAG: PAS domain-containing sensor histidine kinase [Leptolyngbyaceae bacterium]|nr:PAS domain-containing sensor histidine kinase [Leptolyngbyaceae bacterium]
MAILAFLLGLSIGLVLLKRHQSQFRLQLRTLANQMGGEALASPFATLTILSRGIATQKQNIHELQQEVDLGKQLLQIAPVGYLQVDEENQLVWCNSSAKQLLGIQQWEPQKPRLLLEIVRSYELDQLIENTRQAQKPVQQEWVFHPVGFSTHHFTKQQACALRGHGLPLLNDQVGVFLESRQEAVTLAQQRDRWTSDVAHELKTPLTSIRLVAETLQTRLDSPLRSWVDRLLSEVMRLSNLVQDLLDLSQMEMKAASSFQRTALNFTELTQSVWGSLEPLACKKQLRLEYVGDASVLIQADEAQLHRVLINLLHNSIKYSPPRQQIRVQASVQDLSDHPQGFRKQLHFEVIDAGPGFLETDLPHVFERFYRADRSRSRQSPIAIYGQKTAELISSSHLEAEAHTVPDSEFFDLQQGGSSGLGLAIVQKIVEAHQGLVTASNHPDTGGAWLQVFLPFDA